MAVTSTQLTQKVNQQANPIEATFNIWLQTRYLVAQKPAASDYTETKPGYYQGRYVIPGPKYDPKLSNGLAIPHLTINDFQLMMNQYYIRFVDNKTTDGAGEEVSRALFTVMGTEEADAYESKLRKYYGDRRKTIPG